MESFKKFDRLTWKYEFVYNRRHSNDSMLASGSLKDTAPDLSYPFIIVADVRELCLIGRIANWSSELLLDESGLFHVEGFYLFIIY